MVESISVDSAYDQYGDPLLLGEDIPSAVYPDPSVTKYAVSHAFVDSNSFPSYAYTNKVDIDVINMGQIASNAKGRITDPSLVQIVDYDGELGINLNSYVKGRHFIIVTDETAYDNPTIDESYGNDRIVLFAGYNKSTYGVNLSSLDVHPTYVGIENLLNEIKILGRFEHNAVDNQSLNFSTTVHTDRPCVFNPNGRPNRGGTIKVNASDTAFILTPVFKSTGLNSSDFWTLGDILKYLIGCYMFPSELSSTIDDGKYLNMVSFTSKFFKIDADVSSDAFQRIPHNLDLTGLGVYDALVKVAVETRQFSLARTYDSQGRCLLAFKDNLTSSRDAGESGMTLNIGELLAPANKQNIVEDLNLNLNRETNNVGRVIVLGDHLVCNTLASTARTTVDYPMSSQADELSSVSGITDFTEHLQLVLVGADRSESGVVRQTYAMTNKAWLDFTLANLGFDEEDTNETYTYFFKSYRAIPIIKALKTLLIQSDANSFSSAGVYIAMPSTDKRGDPAKNYPTQKINDETFYYIAPIEKLRNHFEADFKENDDFGSIIITETEEADLENGATTVEEYISNCSFGDVITSDLIGDDDKCIPMFVRCSVICDYRIKGIAEIDGFDPEFHETVYVEDKSFKAEVSFKDASYANGAFTAIEDGAINETAFSNTMSAIQSKAEYILSKYTTVQNSGVIPLAGIQFNFKVGQYITEITGTGRTIPLTTVINNVVINLREKSTTIELGARYDQIE